MENNLRTLGPQEAKTVLSFREQGRSVVLAADVIELLGSETTARKVIRNLLRKGWLTRLVAGRYLFLPPEHGPENLGENNALALASAVVEPSYVGWWAAASWHGFTTQKPMTISVATQRPMPPRTIEGNEIRFVKVVERKFFGFKTYDLYGREVTLSTPVKTLADCLDRPDLAGGASEIARIVYGASVDANPEDVIDTALRMKSTALLQRLGFLSDLVGWTWSDALRARLRAAIAPSTRTIFGRAERKEGDIGYVNAWGLLVHATESDLMADVPKARRKETR
ncbi:transcriptional regulator [Opitutaceae bacterium TAV4]|nr:transcriptional regulator [Opitutaceae bacterium TAV4]RRK00536.1 transcriptional regulator [Opitutaceae bacterium TAV3]